MPPTTTSNSVPADPKTGNYINNGALGTVPTPNNTYPQPTPIQPAPAFTAPTQPVTVATSTAAKEDLTGKQTFLNNAEQSIQQQQFGNLSSALQKFQADQQAKKEADELALKNKEIDAKTALTGAATGTTTGTTTTSTTDTLNKKLATLDDETTKAYDEMAKTVDQIRNGTMPLNQYEETMVTALQGKIGNLLEAQKLANANYEGGVTQAGIISGVSRYSPIIAQGQIFQAVSDGLKKIQEIELAGAEALAKMKQGFADKKYDMVTGSYDKFVALQDKRRKTIQDTLEAVAAHEKELREANAKVEEQRVKDINTVILEAGKNSAPPEVIDAITSAKNMGQAVALAGDYLQSGPGIIGEYNFYKRDAMLRGQVPVDFQTYQDIDANRKRSISSATSFGTLNNQQQAVFNKIVDKYNASPAIKALDRANQLRNIVADIKKNPANASSQLNLIYAYVKGLDTDSAVREGELDLVRGISSYLGQFGLQFERLTKNKIITTDVALEIANGADKLIDTIEDTAHRKQKIYDAQAKQNGEEVFGAWKGFTTSIQDEISTPDRIAKEEQDAENQVIAKSKADPKLVTKVQGWLSNNDSILGRPLTYSEILSTYPEYFK